MEEKQQPTGGQYEVSFTVSGQGTPIISLDDVETKFEAELKTPINSVTTLTHGTINSGNGVCRKSNQSNTVRAVAATKVLMNFSGPGKCPAQRDARTFSYIHFVGRTRRSLATIESLLDTNPRYVFF